MSSAFDESSQPLAEAEAAAGGEAAGETAAAASGPERAHTELAEVEGQEGAAGAAPQGAPEELFRLEEAEDLSGLEALLSDDFARISAERDEFLDALKRLQADFDNYRKRTERQQAELRQRASEALVVRLLPVLDSLELAITHLGLGTAAPTDEASSSLLQVNSQLRDILGREGLERIDAVGVSFDPTVHEATAMDESEPEAEGAAAANEPAGPTVTAVWRSGYRLGDRVIRPAMVQVRG